MRITAVDVLPLRAPLICPFRITTGQHDHLDNLLVRMRLENGVEGFGEAAIAPHITGESVQGTQENLKRIGQELRGQNARHYLKISRWLSDCLPENKAASAALEMALLDAVTKTRGIPLWRLFGKRPARLRSDITIVISSLDETIAAAKKFYRQGFRQFKIKIGKDKALDLKRVLSVHQHAPEGAIYLDANQGYTANETIRFLKELAGYHVHPVMIEQPVPKDDHDGLCRIKEAKLTLVCVDESARSLQDCQRIIKRKAADIINIKLMKTGFYESVAIARLAQAHGLKLMIGGMMESTLAMTAAAHVAAGLRCFDFVDLDTPFFIKGKYGKSPYLDKKGNYDLSTVKEGIGI